MTQILLAIGIFYAGFALGYFAYWWIVHKKNYSGTIYVTHSDEKTLYSLELKEYPESIQLRKEVVFKVDISGESLNRK